MFSYKLKPDVKITTGVLSEPEHDLFIMHREKLDEILERPDHFYLITGGDAAGKSSFAEQILQSRQEEARRSRRECIEVRVPANVREDPETKLGRLEGEIRRYLPGRDKTHKREWRYAIRFELTVPSSIKVGLEPIMSGSEERDKPEPLLFSDRLYQAKELLQTIATTRRGFLVKRAPIVTVVIDGVTTLNIVEATRELFDVNDFLDEDRKVLFLIVGSMQLHDEWWRRKNAHQPVVMSNFVDVYLSLVWNTGQICEYAIAKDTINDKSLYPAFRKYLVLVAHGQLRGMWTELYRCSHEGISTGVMERYARLYDVLFERPELIRLIASRGHRVEWADRARWVLCYIINWLMEQWTTDHLSFGGSDVDILSSQMSQVIPLERGLHELIDGALDVLVQEGYLLRSHGEFHLPQKACMACGWQTHRFEARFCIKCGTVLPTDRMLKPTGPVCPVCGRANRLEAHFCLHCGHRLGIPQVVPPKVFPVPMLPSELERLQIGTRLADRYVIMRRLGGGGMGTIYLVEDTRLFGQKLALKELLDWFTDPSERQQAIQQFEREAQLLASLRHRNFPLITDYFSAFGRHYLVMEFIEGQTLTEVLESSPDFLPVDTVIGWIRQLCDVLDYLHSRQPPIIFRDLKPSNIMLTNDGTIKLIDFGIARAFTSGKQADTAALGTVGYAPPEQYGKGQTDARSDIYALGVTMHHLLTKYDPTSGPAFSLPPARSLNPQVSKHLEAVIGKATRLASEDRFQTAREFQKALESM